MVFNVLSVLAVFKDDAYHTDWHVALIGPSLDTSTFWSQPALDSRASLIYTLTSRAILAAINPKDGELVWRQQLASAESNGVARAGAAVVVAAVGSGVSSFDAANGRLVWDNEFSDKVLDLGVTDLNAVAVLFVDGTVRLLNENTGEVAWEWKGLDRCVSLLGLKMALTFVCSTDTPLSLHLSDSTVTVASSQLADNLLLTEISLATGKSAATAAVVASVDVAPKLRVVGGDRIVGWTEDAGRTLKFLPLGGASPVSVAVAADVVSSTITATKDAVLVQLKTPAGTSAVVYKLVAGAAEKVYNITPRPGPAAFSLSVSGVNTYVVLSLPNETAVYGLGSDLPLASFPPEKAQDVAVAHAISEVALRADGSSFAVRTFVSAAAPGFVGNTHLIRNGKLAWTRKESLSSVVASTWVELLDAVIEEIVDELAVEIHQNVAAAYLHRVKRHLHELVVYGPDWAKALPARIYAAFLTKEELTDEHTGKWRDFFGFRKYAVVFTAEGGMAAIDVGKRGEVVWEAFVANNGVAGIYEVRKGTVGIVFDNGEYFEYNAFDGAMLLREHMGSKVWATALVDTLENKKAAVAVLANGNAVTLPSGYEHTIAPVYLTVHESARAVKGVRVAGNTKKASTTWTFVPPAESEEITSITTRPLHDPVASIGIVLGDRSVMYKYLNQHLLLIATANPALSSGSIYLLDSVSGTILHTATHQGIDTTQPIVATVAENWLVYTYFGDVDLSPTDAAKAYHLIVSELFESPAINDRGPLGPAANVSSFTTPTLPYVLSQNYILPAPIISLAVTSTLQGITSREILALGSNGRSIATIPKRVLDPRRPVGRDTTPAEKEEGLFRYNPVVELDPRGIITHERQVLGLERVVAAPSLLESTCLVFAYGGDLFGTRVAPSLAFDILGKGFGKVQLVATVVGLAVGAAVVAPIVRRKQINAKWMA